VTTAAVVFPVGNDRYAVVASVVREVVSDPSPTRLPTAPSVLLGVFNLRGEVIPMFDTAALLGIGRVSGDTPGAIVVDTSAGAAALVVGGLPQFAVLESAVRSSELRGALGVYTLDGEIVVLLDVEVLLMAQTGRHDHARAEVLMSS
jgi:purine-binding chemotaxis protein CheW